MSGFFESAIDLDRHGEQAVDLPASRAHMDLAMEAGALGFWSYEIATDVVRWSASLERMHGFEDGQFPGTFDAFVATIHPEDVDEVLAGVKRCIETGDVMRNEFRFVRTDGTSGWIRGAARVVHDGSGQPATLVGVAIDETLAVAQREELRFQRDQIADALNERENLFGLLRSTLLPAALASPPGFKIDAAFSAASSGATGDFYDLFPLQNHDEWLLSIGDIAGHGPEAAVLTGSVRRSIQAAATLSSDPSSILAAANSVHLANTVNHRFCTAHAITLRQNPNGAAEMAAATAGHVPMLVIRKDGSTEEISGGGPALGIFAAVIYRTVKVDLQVGDVVLAYTDGISEAGSHEPDRSYSDHLSVAAEIVGSGPTIDGAAASLLAAARARDDGIFRDDAACVFVQVLN